MRHSKQIYKKFDIYKKTNIDVWGELILKKNASYKITSRLVQVLFSKIARQKIAVKSRSFYKWKKFNKKSKISLNFNKLLNLYWFKKKYDKRTFNMYKKNFYRPFKKKIYRYSKGKRSLVKIIRKVTTMPAFKPMVLKRTKYKFHNLFTNMIRKMQLNKTKLRKFQKKKSLIILQKKNPSHLIKFTRSIKPTYIIKSNFYNYFRNFRLKKYLGQKKINRFTFNLNSSKIYKKKNQSTKKFKFFKYEAKKLNLMRFYSAPNEHLSLGLFTLFELNELNLVNVLIRASWLGSYYFSKSVIKNGGVIVNGQTIDEIGYFLCPGDNLIINKHFRFIVYKIFFSLLKKTFFFSKTIFRKYKAKLRVSRFFWKRKNYLKKSLNKIITLGVPKYMEVNYKFLSLIILKNPQKRDMTYSFMNNKWK